MLTINEKLLFSAVTIDKRVAEMSSRSISAQLKRSQGWASNLKRFEISSDTESYGNELTSNSI